MIGLSLGQVTFEALYLLTDEVKAARVASLVTARARAGALADDSDEAWEAGNTFELIDLLETCCRHALADERIEPDHDAYFVCAGITLNENHPVAPRATVAIHGKLTAATGPSRQFHLDIWSHGSLAASAVVKMVKSIERGHESKAAMPPPSDARGAL